MASVLQLIGITKRFPGVVANEGIDFDLEQGEIHALLGENGAGKTTLMDILFGLLRSDEGEIRLRGQACHIRSPRTPWRSASAWCTSTLCWCPRSRWPRTSCWVRS